MNLEQKQLDITAPVAVDALSVNGELRVSSVRLSGRINNGFNGEIYDGDYEITPSTEDQILSTDKKLLRHDIVVKAIPSNYGLVTRVGSILTIT